MQPLSYDKEQRRIDVGSKEEKALKTEKRQGKVQRKRMVGGTSNMIQRHELKPGDHIYTWRHGYLYSHHGIYVGDEKVVHFTQKADGEIGRFSSFPSNSSSSSYTAYGVTSSSLEHFLDGGELYLFKYGVSLMDFAQARGGTCTLAASDPPEHVIRRAEFLLQHGFGVYALFNNNCEDFAIYCKTEVLGGSGQVASFVAALAGFGFGFGLSFYIRVLSDIQSHRDAKRIPVEKLVARNR